MAALHVLVVVLDGDHVRRPRWNHELDPGLQEEHRVLGDDEADQLRAEGICAHGVEEHREKPNIGPNGEHVDGIEDVPQERNRRSVTGQTHLRSLKSSSCRTPSTRISSPNPRHNSCSHPDPKPRPQP